MKDKSTLDDVNDNDLTDEEIREQRFNQNDFRIAVEATTNMLDKLEPESPETFYGSLVVIIHKLFNHAPNLQSAMELISVVIQDNVNEAEFNKYFKKPFRTDPFFAQKERTLH